MMKSGLLTANRRRSSGIGITCLFCLFLLGCTSAEKGKDSVVDVASAFSDQKPLKASDYFANVRYIPLETTDESIIGKDAQMQFVGDNLLITTSQGQCLLFDKNTGKFLATVGHRGEDPEGYSSANAWIDSQAGTIHVESFNNAWVTFDSEGRFRERISLPLKTTTGVSFTNPDADTYAGYCTGVLGDGDETENVLFFNKSTVLKRIPLQDTGETSFDPSNIGSINVFKGGEDGYKQFGSPNLDGIIDLQFKDPDRGFIQLMGVTRFWHVGSDLYFKADYNDTIYQVKQQELIPLTVLDLGEYHWPYAERFNRLKDHSFYITHILDNDDLMLFRFVRYLFNAEKRTAYNAVWNKRSGEVRISPLANGIEDDLTRFFPLHPLAVSPSSGEYGGIIQAFDVVEWFDEKKEISPEIEHLKSVGEEDNPVIVFFSMK